MAALSKMTFDVNKSIKKMLGKKKPKKDKYSMNKKKKWECPVCGQIVHAETNPTGQFNWSDGHSCEFDEVK